MYGTGARGGAAAWLILALGLLTAAAEAQTIEAGPLRLDLTGRVQVQLNTTSVDQNDIASVDQNDGVELPPSSAFELRRIRLGTGFQYGEWITGKVEGDFSGAAAKLTDGYIDLAITEPLRFRAGQFHRPFGVFQLESSTRIRTIERGLRIRGLEELVEVPGETQWLLDESGYLGRQIGVMAHGEVGRIGYAAGVFNGEGPSVRETASSKAYAGRLTYGVPLEVLEPLELGAGVSVQPTESFDGIDEGHGTAIGVDATWGGFRRQGLHVKAEWMRGDNPLLAVAGDPPTMVGAHALVAWFAPRTGRVEGIEPVLRLSWGDPDVDAAGDEGTLVTPGVNMYFQGRNRLMLNGDIYLPGQEQLGAEFALVAQLQVYF